MKPMNVFPAMCGVVASLTLGGCANTNDAVYGANAPHSQVATARDVYPGYGVVQSIELVQQHGTGDGGVGLGTIAGAVVGGVAGSQVGSGRGRTAATILGAAGGAYIGHELEKRPRQANAYRVTVRMDDGSYQALLLSTDAHFRVGDRVKIENGVLYRY